MNETSNVACLSHQADIEMRGLTRDELATCLGLDIKPTIEKIPVKAIIAACENYLGVNYAGMRAHLRTTRMVHARRFTWAAIRCLRPDFHLAIMGDWFDRDHSTISFGIRHQPIAATEAEQIARMARLIARAYGRRELVVA